MPRGYVAKEGKDKGRSVIGFASDRDPSPSAVRCAQVSGYESPYKVEKRKGKIQIDTPGATLSFASQTIHPSIAAPSSSVPSAITLSEFLHIYDRLDLRAMLSPALSIHLFIYLDLAFAKAIGSPRDMQTDHTHQKKPAPAFPPVAALSIPETERPPGFLK